MSALAESTLIQAGLQAGLFDNDTLARLRPVARTRRTSLMETLATECALPQTAFYLAFAEIRGLPYAHLARWTADEILLAKLPAALLKRHPMAVLRDPAKVAHLALANPDDALGVETARRVVGALPLAIAEPEGLATLLLRLRGKEASASGGVEDPVMLFERIVREAFLRRASDIHVEAIENGARVRLRVDGRLEILGAPLVKELGEALISRIKVLSGMDIAEARAPQDGSLVYPSMEGGAVEMRVASAPVKFGERLTLRVMKSDPNRRNLDSLGLPGAMTARLRQALGHPHGIVLVTGPTGSGKSTTLYCALRELDADSFNILTAEDPIEQIIPGVSQVQVNAKVGFADALRSFLRHDPDVILVGEIRDLDTADVALKAATTGHMVLSTLHTNSAPGAITRLTDLGCERFMLGATLRGILAQRLVRMLCPHCRRMREATPEERRLLGLAETASEGEAAQLWDATGCPRCLGSGYRGRIGLYEALWVDGDTAVAISAGANERDIAATARDYWRLADDARDKVLTGMTSLNEARAFL
ncbi:MAG: GspE/PulE family protein [Azoarcus sp.]|jgi:type IV pilus assembly protein PilB|nr:GspE/PulE family protein [Azoarcus sp.]